MSLAETGFLHAARREQVAGVFERYYRDATEPLVLLTIDTDRLGVPWREEPVGAETYPHVHGPLSPAAVTDVTPLRADGSPARGLTEVVAREVLLRTGLTLLAMFAAYGGSRIGARPGWAWGEFVGAVTGLAAGAALAVVLHRRWGLGGSKGPRGGRVRPRR